MVYGRPRMLKDSKLPDTHSCRMFIKFTHVLHSNALQCKCIIQLSGPAKMEANIGC